MRENRITSVSVERLKKLVEEERKGLGKRRRRKQLVSLGIVLFAAIFLIVLFREVIGMRMVWGESMYPSYQAGDMIVYRRTREKIRIGDVVVIETDEGELLKRIAGLPGDIVEIEEGSGRVRRNEITQEELYAIRKEKSESSIEYPYEVGEGEIFVLGDNREYSMDSRNKEMGNIRLEQIKGKVILVIRKIRDGRNE
ncbi:signal peptidase I [Anaerolentibacter hominis]|uniref:signal peptidase I n=1 Tax=Anaerolentibacter hominis TaxID=3079009 RepID=UPI0031B80219